MGNKVLSSGTNEKFLYLRIEGTMHKQDLKCDAKNDVSTQTASYTIELSCNEIHFKKIEFHQLFTKN